MLGMDVPYQQGRHAAVAFLINPFGLPHRQGYITVVSLHEVQKLVQSRHPNASKLCHFAFLSIPKFMDFDQLYLCQTSVFCYFKSGGN
jgi:hypothetical protein